MFWGLSFCWGKYTSSQLFPYFVYFGSVVRVFSFFGVGKEHAPVYEKCGTAGEADLFGFD